VSSPATRCRSSLAVVAVAVPLDLARCRAKVVLSGWTAAMYLLVEVPVILAATADRGSRTETVAAIVLRALMIQAVAAPSLPAPARSWSPIFGVAMAKL